VCDVDADAVPRKVGLRPVYERRINQQLYRGTMSTMVRDEYLAVFICDGLHDCGEPTGTTRAFQLWLGRVRHDALAASQS
jgi:hypothetical protein